MAGRHEQPHRQRRRASLPLLAVLIVVTVAGSASAVIALRHHGKKASPPVASKMASPSAATCRGTLRLQVDAAHSIAGPVRTIATKWAATHPSAGGQCVSVVVKAVESAKEATQLASATSLDTTLWIPDSSLWAERIATDKPGGVGGSATIQIGAPIASAPLVLVASPSEAAG